MPIKINYKKCCWKDGKCTSCGCGSKKSCNGCVEICPVGALARKDVLKFNANKCISCGACVNACKHKALSLV